MLAAYLDKTSESDSLIQKSDQINSGVSVSDAELNKYHDIRSNRANLPSVINDHIQVQHQQSMSNTEQPIFHRLVRCFNISSNFRSIMSTYRPSTAIPTINALKSVGCIMILNFHLIWFSIYTLNNSTEVFALGEQLQWQWLSTAPLMVDIFFIIR